MIDFSHDREYTNLKVEQNGVKTNKVERSEGMFGQYKHTLDNKGRLIVPSKLREEFGDAFYLAKAPDGCLSVYPEKEWQKVLDRSNELPASKMRSMRYFFGSVAKCEPDKQGRFLLPEGLRKYANISQEVIIVGLASRAEIWAADRYEADEEKYLTPEAIAAVMEELGF